MQWITRELFRLNWTAFVCTIGRMPMLQSWRRGCALRSIA